MGAIFSFMTILLVLSYAGYKLQVLIDLNDYTIQERHTFEFFNSSDPFGHKQEFAFAVALVKWDADGTPIEDPTIGTVKFIKKAWGYEGAEFFTELESHYCDPEELQNVAGSNEDANFYPLSKLSETFYDQYGGRFKCLDNPERDLNLHGNYDTISATNMMVVFDVCNNETSTVTCKSQKEINEFLTFKYFITLENSKLFVQDEFSQERILKKSKTHWFPLDYQTRTEYVLHLQRTDMHFIDRPLTFGDIHSEDEKGFYMIRRAPR